MYHSGVLLYEDPSSIVDFEDLGRQTYQRSNIGDNHGFISAVYTFTSLVEQIIVKQCSHEGLFALHLSSHLSSSASSDEPIALEYSRRPP